MAQKQPEGRSIIDRLMNTAELNLSAAAARRRKVAPSHGTSHDEVVLPLLTTVSTSPKSSLETLVGGLFSNSKFETRIAGPVAGNSKQTAHLNGEAKRIQLQQGQATTISGLCSLWVEDGTVTILGAVFSESKNVHRLYSPTTHASLQVRALSRSATITLGSIQDGCGFLPDTDPRSSNRIWSAYPKDKDSLLSFHATVPTTGKQNLSGMVNDEVLPMTTLDTSPWDTGVNNLSLPLSEALEGLPRTTTPRFRRKKSTTVEPSNKVFQPRILVTGIERTGMSTFAKCVLNRMLTEIETDGLRKYPRGVMFLDLDHSDPEFAPPGCFYLSQITTPILGPAFTHYCQLQSSGNQLLRIHYLNSQSEGLSSWRFGIADWLEQVMLDFLKLLMSDKYKNIPMIVNLSGWFAEISSRCQMDLANNEIALTDVVCFDTPTNSKTSRLWEPLSDTGTFRVHTVIQKPMRAMMNNRELFNINMQSYCRINGHRFNRPIWLTAPLNFPSCVLTYKDHLRAVVSAGENTESNVADLLRERTVAIIAIEANHELSAANINQVIKLPRKSDHSILGLGGDRLPFQPRDVECLGLGHVYDADDQGVSIHSPVGRELIRNIAVSGRKFALVLGPRTDWLKKEKIQAAALGLRFDWMEETQISSDGV